MRNLSLDGVNRSLNRGGGFSVHLRSSSEWETQRENLPARGIWCGVQQVEQWDEMRLERK